MTIQEASKQVLAALEGKGQFKLTDPQITPYRGQMPKEGVISVNTGMGLTNLPRNGKAYEYSGLSLFNVMNPNPEQTYHRLMMFVGIDQRWQSTIHEVINKFAEREGHEDVAICGLELEVRLNSKGLPYIGVSDADGFEVMDAYNPKINTYNSPNKSVTEWVENTARIRHSSPKTTALSTYLWGDDEIWDHQIIIPNEGPIMWRKQAYKDLDLLSNAIIESPLFMRVHDSMNEDIFRRRCQKIEEALKSLDRDDFDGISDNAVSMAALKTLPMFRTNDKPIVITPLSQKAEPQPTMRIRTI